MNSELHNKLHKELTALLNRHSAENESDTPDFILSRYLLHCLEAFDGAINQRTKWYGPPPQKP